MMTIMMSGATPRVDLCKLSMFQRIFVPAYSRFKQFKWRQQLGWDVGSHLPVDIVLYPRGLHGCYLLEVYKVPVWAALCKGDAKVNSYRGSRKVHYLARDVISDALHSRHLFY